MNRAWMGCLAAVMVISGCGYRFSNGNGLPDHMHHVFVAMLHNHTMETGVESVLTNDLIYEFSRAGTLADSMASADGRLSGAIESISRETVSRLNITTSLERQVSLTVALRLQDPQGNTVWSGTLTDNEDYLVEADKASTDSNLRHAIDVLSKRLAQKIYYQIAEQF